MNDNMNNENYSFVEEEKINTAPKSENAAGESSTPKPSKKKMSAKRRKKRFKRALKRYVIILAVIFAAALAVLWVLLGNYQAKQDVIANDEAAEQARLEEEAAYALAVKRAPQRTFEKWFADTSAEEWADMWNKNHPESIDSKDKIVAYFDELLSADDVALYKGLDSTEETPVYVIKNTDGEIARVSLIGKDLEWIVSDVRFKMTGDNSASVRVVAGTKVFCNGVELSEEYRADSEVTFTYEPLKDYLVNPTTWETYKVEGLLFEPEMTFEAPSGCSVTETATGDCFLCLEDGDEANWYKEVSVNFVRAYLNYYLGGYNNTSENLYRALEYLQAGSYGYNELQNTYVGVVWNSAHSNINTSDMQTGGVVVWADNCYSVDVTYHATGDVSGQLDEYSATMRVYFTNDSGEFAITHFETL